jgi:broad specificity phosphatase PhoE
MTSGKLRRLQLIRHAEYVGFSRDTAQFIGRTDPPLSPTGRIQARTFGLANPELRRLPIFSSPALRARQTAELALPGVALRITPKALEGDYGRLEGLTVAEATRLYPEQFGTAGGSDKFDYRTVGGECLADLVNRADALIDELGQFPDAAVFSHGMFLTVLAHRLDGLANLAVPVFDLCSRLSLQRERKGNWAIRP